MPKPFTEPGDKCPSIYCDAIMSEKDIDIGVCPKCGTMLYYNSPTQHLEKIEKIKVYDRK
jgi:hypothetical protein